MPESNESKAGVKHEGFCWLCQKFVQKGDDCSNVECAMKENEP